MRKIAFVFLSLLLPLMAGAQNQKDSIVVIPTVSATDENAEIFTIVENDPTYPGGEKARSKFLSDNIIYPIEARKNGIEGIVYVTFVVEKDGSITKAKIVRNVGGGLGEEALRVIKLMPKWNPGKQRGKPVRVMLTLPVKFVLN